MKQKPVLCCDWCSVSMLAEPRTTTKLNDCLSKKYKRCVYSAAVAAAAAAAAAAGGAASAGEEAGGDASLPSAAAAAPVPVPVLAPASASANEYVPCFMNSSLKCGLQYVFPLACAHVSNVNVRLQASHLKHAWWKTRPSADTWASMGNTRLAHAEHALECGDSAVAPVSNVREDDLPRAFSASMAALCSAAAAWTALRASSAALILSRTDIPRERGTGAGSS